MKKENPYRKIMKGMSIFGGVQVFNILISLVRGKFVAMFLGPVGMGISSIYNTSLNTIQRISSLGLNLAIVKEIAATKDDPEGLGTLLALVNRMVLITGLIGAVVCIGLSPWLSRLSFGDYDHTWSYMLLGVVTFFSVAYSGKMSVLQGMHHAKALARASIAGSLTGLFVGVPLYYFFGYRAIVPAMLIMAVTLYGFYAVPVARLSGKGARLQKEVVRPMVRKLIGMGIVLIGGDAIGSLCNYLINFFIRNFGDLADVGFWQAATSLTTQYSSVVFSALAMDYLPRLIAGAKGDNVEFGRIIDRQTEMVALVMAPLAAMLLTFTPLVVRILLTTEFNTAIPLIRWFAFGLIFKAMMFPLGYVSFAKDNKKVFFWLEGVTCNVLQFGLFCLAYLLFGLIGLGYAMVADCVLSMVLYYVVNYRLYGVLFSRRSLLTMVYSVVVGGAVFGCTMITDGVLSMVMMCAVTGLSLLLSLLRLKKLFRSKG